MSQAHSMIVILLICGIIVIESKSEVRFVNVVFRHGDRALQLKEDGLYPGAPSINDITYPMGIGGLTNEGKRNTYKLGEELRKRYDDFLGEVYFPNDVQAISTDTPRTKMSLSLVLASLYPPAKLQQWNSQLNWQPIPIDFISTGNDTLFVSKFACPRYTKEQARVKSSSDFTKMTEKFRPYMEKLSNVTGGIFDNVGRLGRLYHGLRAQESLNLTLPKWANDVYPDGILRDAAILKYNILSYNDLMKKLNGGMILKRMVDDMKAVVNGSLKQPQKISLYSGHALNVASSLINLGLFKPHVPEYSSAVIIELVRHDEKYYVKVVHYLGIPAVFEELEIPNCGELCPLDKFIDLMKDVLPRGDKSDCAI